jgi:hypothetical protein
MTQNVHADLLPWILGALLAGSAATVAVSAPPATPAPGGAASSSAPAPPPARAATSGAGTPQVAAAAHAPLPPGQVWQCVIDGERTFSDAPCGEHASIRQLRELNVMDAPPARSYGYAYPSTPSSAPAPTYAPTPPDDSDYADPWGPDVLWAHGYARRNYFPRQDNHIRPQPQVHPHPHTGRN